ncbi:hypothetical protein DVH24_026707 [Malus domestica]|uniref:Uncharacterized protein n=1 Tax=Malus domestica TaxID=3750 RepID=A0A498K4E9_MALDO|nr:hypothetical protein DVH24_026707 [Malus domestica]
MGTTALRQLLNNLCSNSPWNYADFVVGGWVLSSPKAREAVEHASDDIYFSNANQMLFKGFATSIHDGGSTGYPIGLAVADMSYLQHTFGKGVVGEVACTGNYSWVFLDNLCTRESGSKLVPERSSYTVGKISSSSEQYI